MNSDPPILDTPVFIVDPFRLRRNLEILNAVKQRTGCRILLAQKGFAMWHLYPMMREYLDGVCASSPNEARLGYEEFGGEVHVFAAAYSESDIKQLLPYCSEIDFNSFSQWRNFHPLLDSSIRNILCGLRINPECSTQKHAIYDPCASGSRLGIRKCDFEGQSLEGITGLHFHTLCEQNADALAQTLEAVENKFGDIIPSMSWVNFGGGHHITRNDYDIDLLCSLICGFKDRYDVDIYLEPGEAVALNTGVLVASVLDVVHNDMDIAILDVSCTAHMPDVLEMPYRPEVSLLTDDLFPTHESRAGVGGNKRHTYRLAGHSCLAGDIIGDYSFDRRLEIGDRLIFEDMAHYTMVKTSMFNGIQHPSIATYDSSTGDYHVVRTFTYDDYKNRLS